ncbi:TRICHOME BIREFRINGENCE-LIKE 20 [Rhynchospora pubera]|uniref:TRICHOME BIREFRINGENCE-LIKE 20 n=1 Tax=Rhynchospora pubera TaxID=906938 RepID=A0AAV8FH43_9POAL|nr:TRICHOME BIREFRINGENCE-LIKE 20 [Rhynchospora pubera]KAJ4790076.1 TRICHOME BIREFRINGENCE-LIKE 20 [Rhynchospora pubera]
MASASASAVFLGFAPRFQNGTELLLLLQKKVTSFLLLSLGLSSILLLLTWGASSNTFMFTPKQALSDSAPSPGYPKITDDLTPTITYGEAVLPSGNLIADNSTATVSSQVPNNNSSPIIEPCDMSTGKWVRETREPIYSNLTCPFIPENKNCQQHGKSPGYLYWRWKPDGCDLPWFEPNRFLSVVRGKTFAFVGDSLARNHFDSLVCLLSQAEVPTNGDRNPYKRFLKVHFPSSNFTVMMIWTEFYVLGMPRTNASTSFDIHLDKINTAWTSRLPSLDYLVISGGNWLYRKNYLYESNKLIGCVYCRGENLTEYSLPYVIRRVVRKALESIQSCQNCDKLLTFLRSHTTSHFEKGSWFNGGFCNRTEPLNESELDFDAIEWEIRKIQKEEIERIKQFDGIGDTNRNKRYKWLDVTKAMMIRADGHPGKYYNKEYSRSAYDCLHWCLPGPVDMWNEMLMLNLINTSSLD